MVLGNSPLIISYYYETVNIEDVSLAQLAPLPECRNMSKS
jgi:hypothetical protein